MEKEPSGITILKKGNSLFPSFYSNTYNSLSSGDLTARISSVVLNLLKVLSATIYTMIQNTKLNPRIGLLGGEGGLKRLEVMGNRFRVPRWSVLERGTDATLRWLRDGCHWRR